MREAIAKVPDGVYQSVMWSNPLGEPMRFPLKLTVAGDRIGSGIVSGERQRRIAELLEHHQ